MRLDLEPIGFPFDPSVYSGLAALLVGFAWLARGRGWDPRRAIYYCCGILIVWAALETPLDPLGDSYLQTAHMVQHMLLIAFAPPFLLLGLSPRMAAVLLRVPGLGFATRIVPAQVIYGVVIVAWHLPVLYNLALANNGVHIAMHLTFLAAGVIFWWPLIRGTAAASRWQMSDPQRILYLLAGMIPMLAVSLVFQFSNQVFYAPYVAAPRLQSWLTPLLDQQLAGVTMLVMDMTTMVAEGLVVFYRWMLAGVNEDLRREHDPEIGIFDELSQGPSC